jgi:mevalonate pyrophosphate decarboxylase
LDALVTNSKEDNERKFIMTATKPATSTQACPVSKKAAKTAKRVGSAESGCAATAAEYNSIDNHLQGMNTHRRYARRGSKTPGMLIASASRFVFDSQQCLTSGRDKLESGVSETTLLNALRLKMQKDSKKYLDYSAH